MEKFVVYGAGKVGRDIYAFLKENGMMDCLYAFCDRDYEDLESGGIFESTRIMPYEDICGLGMPIVIGVGKRWHDEVERILLQDGQRYYADFPAFIKSNFPICEAEDKVLEYAEIRIRPDGGKPVKRQHGFCPFCKQETIFVSYDYKLIRENYRCLRCGTSPRQRALLVLLEEMVPQWRDLQIHESSPSGVVSDYIENCCERYTKSFFFDDKPLGLSLGEQTTNQNLENLTFPAESFDLLITQDVMEHVNYPDKALKEIYRVLKPGGRHIFTVPIWHGRSTVPRIKMENGHRELLLPPVYHGNPIAEEGALLTYEYGDDFLDYINTIQGGETTVHKFPRSKQDVVFGLEAGPDIQVFVTEK